MNSQRDKSVSNRELILVNEKLNRNEKILVKAYQSLKEKEKELRQLNLDLLDRERELKQFNEKLISTNEQLVSQKNALNETLIKLKEAQSQLIQSEKMASVGILTAGIAHEINNPLNFIHGGKTAIEAYIDKNKEVKPEEIKPLIEIITIGIQRATTIVKSLNHFNRKSESNDEPCDIHSIINNCLIMLHNQIKNKIEINKNFTDIPYYHIGNEGKLHQVFLNILTNSVQAIEATGSISIKTQLENENILIRISDNGSGIVEDNMKKITDPFFTTKEPGKGTGLGLYIVYNILEEYKGKITFESSKGVGTSVSITLPVNN